MEKDHEHVLYSENGFAVYTPGAAGMRVAGKSLELVPGGGLIRDDLNVVVAVICGGTVVRCRGGTQNREPLELEEED